MTPGEAVWRKTRQKAALTAWQDGQGWEEWLSVGLGKNSTQLPNLPCSSTCSPGHGCPNNLLAYWLSCSFLKSKILSRLAWEEIYPLMLETAVFVSNMYKYFQGADYRIPLYNSKLRNKHGRGHVVSSELNYSSAWYITDP